MKTLSVSLAVLVMLVGCCGESKEMTPEKKHQQILKTENASQAYSAAVQQAKRNDPAGFLRLFEIASDDVGGHEVPTRWFMVLTFSPLCAASIFRKQEEV